MSCRFTSSYQIDIIFTQPENLATPFRSFEQPARCLQRMQRFLAKRDILRLVCESPACRYSHYPLSLPLSRLTRSYRNTRRALQSIIFSARSCRVRCHMSVTPLFPLEAFRSFQHGTGKNGGFSIWYFLFGFSVWLLHVVLRCVASLLRRGGLSFGLSCSLLPLFSRGWG